MSDLSPELDGKMRQFKRVLLSCADFKHAMLASSYILTKHLHENHPEESYILLEALNCSMVVAYCRPFSRNDSRSESRVPDLPARLLRVLSESERAIHDAAMRDRNTVLAHSDADALQIEPVVWHVGDRPLVLPIQNWGLAPFARKATTTLNAMARKLLEATLKERLRLEGELVPYLRIADLESPSDPSA